MFDQQARAAEELSEPARLFVAALSALREQDPAVLPGPQALAETALLLREGEKLAAVTLARLADVHTRELYALDGAPSASSWVAQQQTSTSRSVVALARRLSRLPVVEAALLDGRLSMPSAVCIGQALEQVRPHVDRIDGLIDGVDGEDVVANVVVEGVLQLLAEARGGFADDDPALAALRDQLCAIAAAQRSQQARLEEAFVLLAEHLEPQHLAAALERLVAAVLPLQLEDRAERGHLERGLRLTRKDDGSGWRITRGDLDLECGELLHTVITAARATDSANPDDTAAWAAQRAGQDALDAEGAHVEPSAPAPRSSVQQDHDALSLGLRRLLDSGALGSRDKVAPHLVVTVGLDALHDRPGALPAMGDSSAVLPAGLVRRLVCDSRLTRVVLSLGRRVLEVSHGERTLKAHERRALRVQWGGRCAGAGCTCPPGTPLVPHHADPWHRTGTTAYRDTVPVCGTTHHDIHEGGRTIRLRDGRYLGPLGWAAGPAAPSGRR